MLSRTDTKTLNFNPGQGGVGDAYMGEASDGAMGAGGGPPLPSGTNGQGGFIKYIFCVIRRSLEN